MSWFETELCSDIAVELESGLVVIEPDSDWVFAKIQEGFSIGFNRIDWSGVPGAVQRFRDHSIDDIVAFMLFFHEIYDQYALSADLIYVGDMLNLGVYGTKENITLVMPRAFEFPQHHYITDFDVSWCMSFTMEGGMGFGFAS